MLARRAWIAVIVSLLVGCGALAGESASSASDRGATPAPNGAPGVCCPASTGGCARTGGYSADGHCDDLGPCDNMCEQRIVPDEHGCPKLTYKRPPVQTTYAGTESCSDPIFNGGDDQQRRDGGPACDYAPVENPPSCPPYFQAVTANEACPMIGIECSYPGEGHSTAGQPCVATARMKCVGEGGLGDAAAGPDAGSGTWVLTP